MRSVFLWWSGVLLVDKFDIVDVHCRAFGTFEVIAVSAGRCYEDYIRWNFVAFVIERYLNLYHTVGAAIANRFEEEFLAVSYYVGSVFIEQLAVFGI